MNERKLPILLVLAASCSGSHAMMQRSEAISSYAPPPPAERLAPEMNSVLPLSDAMEPSLRSVGLR